MMPLPRFFRGFARGRFKNMLDMCAMEEVSALFQENKNLNLATFASKLSQIPDPILLFYLQRRGIMKPYRLCTRCSVPPNIIVDDTVSLGYKVVCPQCHRKPYVFKCNKSHRKEMILRMSERYGSSGLRYACPVCRTTRSVKADSFFSDSRLSIRSLLLLMFLWAASTPLRLVGHFVTVSQKSSIQWFRYFRNICSRQIVTINRGGFRLGGPGRIVEIDEYPMVERKPNQELIEPEKWVFAMYDPYLKFGVAACVEDRSRETLILLVMKYIAPYSIIYSDKWQAYNSIGLLSESYSYGVVNDSKNLVDPETGVCTNSIEGYWSRLKRFIRRKHTRASPENIASYLNEFMWREFYDTKKPIITMNFLIEHLSQWDRYGFT